jgi:tartrate dehydratase beta subunit/fumarate hydratase class I family protein
MSKVKSKELFWDPSPAADVVGHRVYYTQGMNQPVNYDSDFVDVGPETSARIDVVLNGQEEGIFSFGVAAIDDVGNEADIYQHPSWVNVPLDVAPPAPVSGGGIRDL